MSEKQSEIARQRWESLSEKEQFLLKRSIAKGMKNYWSSLTKEQRSEIGKKAAATRRANRERRNSEQRSLQDS